MNWAAVGITFLVLVGFAVAVAMLIGLSTLFVNFLDFLEERIGIEMLVIGGIALGVVGVCLVAGLTL